MTRWILAILSVYRLARLVSQEDGPLFVFTRLRAFTDSQRVTEQQYTPNGLWASLDEGIRCPLCTGVWFAIFCYLLVRFPSPISNFLLGWLGLAGAQTLLQGWSDYD